MRTIWRSPGPAKGLLALLLLCPGGQGALFSQQTPGSDNTYRAAYEQGFVDGLTYGRIDRDQSRSLDWAGKKPYQKANNGFDPSVHDQDVYLVAYRRGFKDGYEEGFGVARRDKPRSPAPPPKAITSPSLTSTSAGGAVDSQQLLLPMGTRMVVRLLNDLSTRRNERGDTFKAELSQDFEYDRRLAIPSKTVMEGVISYLKRPGRIRGKAEIKLLFKEVLLKPGSRIPIEATVIAVQSRPEAVQDEEGTIQGEGSAGKDAKTVGATAAIGALIGLISGGKSGGAIGAGAGAVIGVGGILGRAGSDIDLNAETELVIQLNSDLMVPLVSAPPTP